MKRSLVLFMIIILGALTANAQGMVYDPTEINPAVVNRTDNNSVKPELDSNTSTQKNTFGDQSVNFNNALYELDSAQVNIRNELLECQSKYQEIDTQYKLIKEQRRALANQIREINKRVNAIEKSKNQIRKSMT